MNRSGKDGVRGGLTGVAFDPVVVSRPVRVLPVSDAHDLDKQT